MKLKNTIRLAIICTFLSVLTTLLIHSNVFEFGDLDFNEEIQLYQNFKYNFSKWVIIAHCLFVLITMWVVFLIGIKRKLAWVGLGFVFYVVFAFTEIFRQFLELFYLNGLRQKYDIAETPLREGLLYTQIEGFNYFAYALFGLFMFAIAFGNLFYGIAFLKGDKWNRILSIALLSWGVIGLLALGNEFWEVNFISKSINYISLTVQPLIRFIIGYWLLIQLSKLRTIERKQ
ncbi:hypothetical protein [Xanthomarina gelatinilytica]|uniref:hypothetical protein n=1 Tax=Xanthomarina gelatinilytica TaxID=1137281 RepID=UPI003AA831AB